MSIDEKGVPDVNVVVVTGTVVGEVVVGSTGSGSCASSVLLRVAGKTRRSVAVIRVNAYDDVARCLTGLELHERVVVRGELQTRSVKNGTTVTELKAHQVSRFNDARSE